MSNSNSSSSSGIGFFGLLTVLFIGLKLTGYIDWSWWLVVSPLFAGLIIFVGALGIAAAVLVAATIWIAAKQAFKPSSGRR